MTRCTAILCTAIVLLGTAGAARSASDTAATGSPHASGSPDCIPILSVGSQSVAIDVEGTPRDIIVHIPRSHPGVRLPAVVAFHGYSSFASDLEATSGLSGLADEGGFVVAYPQALGSPTEWHFAGNLGHDQRDHAMTRALLELLIDQACVETGQVVLAGHSMGGGMASDATCRLADQVMGGVLVAALWHELPCQPVRPVPVIAMHALDDAVLPYAGGEIGGVPPGVPDQLSVEHAMAAWAARDGCDDEAVEVPTEGGGAVLTWTGCDAPVVLHRLAGGGHDWPPMASTIIAGVATSG